MLNKKSSLQTRIRTLLPVVFIVMLAMAAFFLRVTMLDGLYKLEDKYVGEHVERVEKKIQERLDRLSQIAKDYAAWDDSYEYITNHNSDFKDRNLTEETLMNLDLDMLIYADRAGRFVFANGLDQENERLIPIYGDLKDQLEKSGILSNTEPDKILCDIIKLDEGLVMVTSHPIIRSDYSGEVRGNLILGQVLDQEAINEIGSSLNLNVQIQRLDLGHDPILDSIRASGQVIIEEHDRNSISAYSILEDAFQQPVAGIIVSMNRDFSAVGLSALNLLIVALCLTALFAMFMTAYMLDSLVLKRLTRLSENVAIIGNESSGYYRLPEDSRGDEISIVSDAINSMLERLEGSKAEIAASTERYRKFVENGRDIIYTTDLNGLITYISPNCKEIIGCDDDEMTGKPFGNIIHPDNLSGWEEILHKAGKNCLDLSSYEFRGKGCDGSWQWFRTNISAITGDKKDIALLGIFYNINESKLAELELLESHANLEDEVRLRTKQLMEANEELTKEIKVRIQAQQKIENLAYYDTLTGLPNRALLVDRIHQAIDLAKRIEKPIGLLYMDLDGFKSINDTLGHTQGDELLKAVSGRLTTVVRESDTVARMGSDEFVIMALNLEDAEKIGVVANKLLDVFKQPFEANSHEVYLTASIGISIFPTDGDTPESLIKDADLAMYKAKDKGKNQCIFCTSVMKDIISENLKLSNGLYRALQRDELEVYYQPQVNQESRSIVGLEALLRWNHPEFGLVPPGKFIHLAEQTGLINPIGRWVLREVCRQNKAWQEAGMPRIRIAVNLSIIQFQSPGIVEQIKGILEETGLEPRYLELEITESIAMRDTEYIISVLNEFKTLGIYISIDDFGTEFSSLNYLKLLPINRIKIPMPFIQGIAVNERDEAITKTIIVLAKNMGLDVIAEGVETRQQEDFLMKRMCNEMQGFYYYRPMRAMDIEDIIRNR